MLLSDRDLAAEVKAGALALEPWEPALVQPSSVDVRLDRLFRVFATHRYTHIDPSVEQADLTELVEVPEGQPFVLHPGEFVLGSTLEVITVGDHLAARLEGKSSLGRLGLLVHSTAGFIDPGFSGHVTLELSNVANLPIMLWPGMKIGQLCVFRLSSPAEQPYGVLRGNRYQGQRGPTASRSSVGWQTWPLPDRADREVEDYGRTWPARAAGTAGAVPRRPGLVATMALACSEHPGCKIGYKAGSNGTERVHIRPSEEPS